MGRLVAVQARLERVFVDQLAAADIDQDRTGLEGLEKRRVGHAAGLVGQGAGQDHHVGVRQQPGQVGLLRDKVGQGIGGGRATDHGQVGAEGLEALGDLVADGSKADQQPAALADLAEAEPAPGLLRLGFASLVYGMQ